MKRLNILLFVAISFLLYGCRKDGAWRSWHKFECTINNIPYFDNPEIAILWQKNTPHMDYYLYYDGNSLLTFYSYLIPKDNKRGWSHYMVRCEIPNFIPDMVGEELIFSIPTEKDYLLLRRISYSEITNVQTGTTCFGEGHLLISSYDETKNKMFGILRIEVKMTKDDLCKPLIIEGNFQVNVKKRS